MELEELFCEIDDFCVDFELLWEQQLLPKQGRKQRRRQCSLSLSEVMTIIVNFHVSSYRNFKHYYIEHVKKYLGYSFPKLVSYNRFIELIPSSLISLICYLNTRKGSVTGINFIDSTRIPVCHNQRAGRNKVFKDFADWGKSSIGWFFGFKLHLVINEIGELLSFKLTPGNTDDRQPVPDLVKGIFGKIFGDKGYISQKLFAQLFESGLQLITPNKQNMKNRLIPLIDKLMLRKRSIIETVNDQLKNISHIVHSRHRSVCNFMVNLIAGLVAYTHQSKKPSLSIPRTDLSQLTEGLAF